MRGKARLSGVAGFEESAVYFWIVYSGFWRVVRDGWMFSSRRGRSVRSGKILPLRGTGDLGRGCLECWEHDRCRCCLDLLVNLLKRMNRFPILQLGALVHRAVVCRLPETKPRVGGSISYIAYPGLLRDPFPMPLWLDSVAALMASN